MRKLFLCLLLITGLSYSHELTVSQPTDDSQGALSLDEAAVQAFALTQSLPRGTEYAGGLYELNGKFYFTRPANSGAYDKFEIAVRTPKGTKLAGIFHTHPGTRSSEFFSTPDIRTAERLNVISYIYAENTHVVRRYDPQHDKQWRHKAWDGGLGNGRRVATLHPEKSTQALAAN